MVDQHVTLAQNGEELTGVVGCLGQPRWRQGRPRLGVQVRPVEGVDTPQAGQIERRRHPEDTIAPDLELRGHQVDDLLTRVRLDFETERLAEPPAA